jgi:hypothetical protein
MLYYRYEDTVSIQNDYSGGMKMTAWKETFGLSKEEQSSLNHYYVLHYGWTNNEGMVRMVSGYFGKNHTDAISLHNKIHNYHLRTYGVCYITTSKKTVDKWINDTLEISKIKTLVI